LDSDRGGIAHGCDVVEVVDEMERKWYHTLMKRILAVLMLTALAGAFAGCFGPKGGKMKLPDNAVLLDVRQADEFNAGHIKGAVLVPHDTIAEKIGLVVPDKNTPVYVYCRYGRRSAIAVEVMKKLGYTNLTDLGGMGDALKSLLFQRK
jgi:phage shock protein E